MTSHFTQKLNGNKETILVSAGSEMSVYAADVDILTSAAHIRPAEAFARRLSLIGILEMPAHQTSPQLGSRGCWDESCLGLRVGHTRYRMSSARPAGRGPNGVIKLGS
jgi:hypothetical protein